MSGDQARPFDAVLFDLDGTLVATDRFWVQAARTGARRAFDELGLERELPDSTAWMRLVGQPLEQGFAELFHDLDPASRAHVQERCVEEEHRLLDAGGAALMPGAAAALDRLRGQGVRMAVASNCNAAYLEHMWGALGLERWMETGRCLDSPAVRNKADMLEQLVDLFDTRSAVMVGDRASDGAAAAANGLPFVLCGFGFAPDDERFEASGAIADFAELGTLLDGRTAGVRAALDAAGCFRETFVAPAVLGIAGPPGSGATLFARDAARVLDADFLPLDAYRRKDAPLALDAEALEREVFEPRARGERSVVRREVEDAGGVPRAVAVDLDPARLLVVEAPYLLDPRLGPRVDRLVVSTASEETSLARLAGRDARRYGPGALERARADLGAWRELTERIDPARTADALVDLENPLAPRTTGPRASWTPTA